jgi:cell fate (sporulation/competence/biofilm development) regulator YmcA (YheA/YmcA/DUF963 family)
VLPFESEAQALDYAEVVIAYSENMLVTILKFPTVEPENFEYNLIRPVILQNGNVISTDIKEVLQNDNNMYSIEKRCNWINKIFLCESENLRKMQNETCIRNTITQKNASCSFSNSHHIKPIEKLAENIVLVNNIKGLLKTSCDGDTVLNGTFILKIVNCSIELNGQKFKFLDKPEATVKEATLQTYPLVEEYQEKLSVEFLHLLHINNTKWLTKVETNQVTHFVTFTSVLVGIALIAAFYGLALYILRKNLGRAAITMPLAAAATTTPLTTAPVRGTLVQETSKETVFNR